MRTIRQELHRIPELSFKEFKTKQYILNRLIDKCEIVEIGQTSLCIYFNFNKEKTIALRAELDALPIKEENEVGYKSTHEGCMHACGHDGHMAILLSLIDDIVSNKISCSSNVLFIFQASEEVIGGSEEILKSGVLDKYHVDEIYGLHIWPNLPKGEIFTKYGALLSKPTEFDIDIVGKSTHVATYYDGKDAIHIGVELLHDINKETRLIDNAIVHIGEVYSHGQRNVVSNNFLCKGTIRTFDDKLLNRVCEIINRWINFYSESFSVKINLSINSNLYPLINDDELVNESLKYGVELLDYPYFHSEDFSLYLKKYRGVYFLLGAGNIPSLHNSKFDFDEEILERGKQLFIKILTK